MMIPLSFRLKLVLSMMSIVAGVSGVTLYITETKVQDAYIKLFKDKLETEINYVPKEQEDRLRSWKNACDRLTGSVRLQASMEEADSGQLYILAYDELRLKVDFNTPENPTAAGSEEPARKVQRGKGKTLTDANKLVLARALARRRLARTGRGLAVTNTPAYYLVGFLDADGKVIHNPGLNPTNNPIAKLYQERIATLGRAVLKLDTQQVGYLDLENKDLNINVLLEVITTPVVNTQTKAFLGTMVFAQPYLDLGEQAVSDVIEIDNGVYFDGRLFSHTIDKWVQRDLKRRLPIELSKSRTPRDDFTIDIEDVPHRVFYTPMNPGSRLPLAYKVGLYSRDAELRAREEIRVLISSFSLIAMLGALAISVLLSHGFAVPINELVSGTAEIQKGNFGIKVPVRTRDEIGSLARSFNEMAEGLAMKEKFRSVLNKVADKDVAEELIKGTLTLGGEMREVTIMFCDIRGFTALSQNMDPKEVIHMLNEHMTILAAIVTKHNGVVDKFIGDSIMAYFGAPKSYGNDALNAVRCALSMINERAKLNETSKYHIQIGIGVATGRVLAGNMGSENRSNYTVIGERVNLASRLCSVAAKMEVVIGSHTVEKLGSLIRVEELPTLRLKGFSDDVTAYRLVEVDSQPVKS
jgi:class 3 adenylate cyclase